MKKKSRKSKMTGCLHILPSLENKNNGNYIQSYSLKPLKI